MKFKTKLYLAAILIITVAAFVFGYRAAVWLDKGVNAPRRPEVKSPQPAVEVAVNPTPDAKKLIRQPAVEEQIRSSAKTKVTNPRADTEVKPVKQRVVVKTKTGDGPEGQEEILADLATEPQEGQQSLDVVTQEHTEQLPGGQKVQVVETEATTEIVLKLPEAKPPQDGRLKAVVAFSSGVASSNSAPDVRAGFAYEAVQRGRWSLDAVVLPPTELGAGVSFDLVRGASAGVAATWDFKERRVKGRAVVGLTIQF